MLTFDTLQYAKDLENTLATKQDVQGLKEEIKVLRTEVHTEISRLEIKMNHLQNRTISVDLIIPVAIY